MEISGFSFIDVGAPSLEEVQRIEEAFNERAAADSTHVLGKEECDEFIESGTHAPVGLLKDINDYD
jgi:hypothetical protein